MAILPSSDFGIHFHYHIYGLRYNISPQDSYQTISIEFNIAGSNILKDSLKMLRLHTLTITKSPAPKLEHRKKQKHKI